MVSADRAAHAAPVVDVKAEWERLFDKVDLAAAWRRHFYGGFDNYDDYEKYGDAFIPVVPVGALARSTRSPGRR